MYNNTLEEAEKKQKHKLLAIAGVMLAVIIVLIAGIVVIANSKTSKKTISGNEQNSEFSIVDSSNKKNENSTTENTDKKTSETNKSSSTSSTSENKDKTSSSTTSKSTTNESTSVKTAENIPKTGPEDLVPIALVLGVLTTVATTVVMHGRRNIEK